VLDNKLATIWDPGHELYKMYVATRSRLRDQDDIRYRAYKATIITTYVPNRGRFTLLTFLKSNRFIVTPITVVMLFAPRLN